MLRSVFFVTFLVIQVQVFSQHELSIHDFGNLKRYNVANQNLKFPSEENKRVVFMGDSNTEYWRSDDSIFFNDQYINRGISGQTTSQMLLRFRQDVVSLQPVAVVILAGVNDIAENTGPISLEDIFGNIVSMIEISMANEIIPIVCSVLPANTFTWRPDLQPAHKIRELNSMLETYCREHQVTYVDYYGRMVDADLGLDKKYSDDGVHPTRAGYAVMEPIIEEAIHKVLKHKLKN